jgi:hypothetical protein
LKDGPFGVEVRLHHDVHLPVAIFGDDDFRKPTGTRELLAPLRETILEGCVKDATTYADALASTENAVALRLLFPE